MAGGPEAAFVRAQPAFEAMGELVLHVGPQGHGSMIKLINNTLAAINAAGLAEGIVLAQTAKLDVDKMLQVVGSGSGESAMRALKSESMVEGDFETLFKLEHMLKDVRYCIAEARKLGLEPAMAQAAEKHYSQARRRPATAESDFAAVIEADPADDRTRSTTRPATSSTYVEANPPPPAARHLDRGVPPARARRAEGLRRARRRWSEVGDEEVPGRRGAAAGAPLRARRPR